MKMNRYSDYEKYIVMIDGTYSSIRGARLGYEAFLDYKKVLEALEAISKGEGTYSYNGDIYKRPITSARASQILSKVNECKWDDDIRVVAKQIGAHRMVSPRK
jgi:hypothetical protein